MKKMDRLFAQTTDEAYREKWIRTCEEQHFPPYCSWRS